MSSDFKLSNKEVVQILKEVLAAMEVKNFSYFEVRAYQNAIAVLDNITSSIYDMWETDRIGDIPGIGGSLTQHFEDLFTTGKVDTWEKAKKDLPEGMFSLLGLRGIGAKKAFKLSSAFELNDRETALDELKQVALAHKIQVLPGFGGKSESGILEAIEQEKMTKNEKERMLLVHAEDIGFRILKYMDKCDEVEKAEFSGSFRRRNPTIGDLDLIVSTNDSEKVIEHFVNFDEVEEVLARGDKKAMVVLKNEVQVDVRISTPKAYGALIQYNTGSKQHNILLRTYALEKGLSLSEYGIKIKKTGEIMEFADEVDFYKKLRLPYIPPEIRDGTEEIEMAKEGKLPQLIKLEDIKGDVHTHTTESDGLNTLDEMVNAAEKRGYEYYGVTDHAPSVQSRGEKEVARLIEDRRVNIERVNKSQNRMKVLFGYEVNILADATMGLPDEFMKELDYAIGGIHGAFTQDKDKMTKRLIAALENPYVKILAHPSGRVINSRDPVDPDWNEVFAAAKANDKILEISGQPDRLDLPYDLVREAIKREIKMMVVTDAHSIDQLLYMRYGIDVARRGWCEAKDVVNTLGHEDFVKTTGIV